MLIILYTGTLKELTDDKDKTLTEEEKKVIQKKNRWLNKEEKNKVDIDHLSNESLTKLVDWLDARSASNRSIALSRNSVKGLIEARNNPTGAIAKKLQDVPSLMKNYILKTSPERRWIYEENEDGAIVPWFVSKVEYTPSSERNGPAAVSVGLRAVNAGSKSSISLTAEDCSRKTMTQILQFKGYQPETEEYYGQYLASVKEYLNLHNQDGLQLSAWGIARATEGWYKSWRPIEKAGVPAKVVIDMEGRGSGSGKTSSAMTCDFWKGEDADEEVLFDVPLHPYLKIFDLSEHDNYVIHVDSVKVYEYDESVEDKIVLSPQVRCLLEVLVEHAKVGFEDIVSGKAGGSIVLCHGVPGTGKTLTAEVYSEVMKRPLYKVQSSQLGISAKSLEDELKTVLARAERWGAILLIDEADVYVAERGNDINQNAIVGVFLRVLEYYRGVLFMTTNRGDMVDDAIESRLTAKIGYEVQDKDGQVMLWKVLCDQNNIKIAAHLEEVVEELGRLSGRSIKNLLKLGKMMANKRDERVSLALLLEIKEFIVG